MKKFLTVLLALSVVFTYTVGTAFAAIPTEDQQDAKDYVEQQAQTYLDGDFEQAVSAYMATLTFDKNDKLLATKTGNLSAKFAGILSKELIQEAAVDAANEAKIKFVSDVAAYKEEYVAGNRTELNKNEVIVGVKGLFNTVVGAYLCDAVVGVDFTSQDGAAIQARKALIVKQYKIEKAAAEAALAYDSTKYSNDVDDWSIENLNGYIEGSAPVEYTWEKLVGSAVGPLTAKEFVEAIVKEQSKVVATDFGTTSNNYADAIAAMNFATTIAKDFIKGHKLGTEEDAYYIAAVPTIADIEDTTTVDAAKATAIKQMEAALTSKSIELEAKLNDAIAALDKLATLSTTQKKQLKGLEEAKANLDSYVKAAKDVYTAQINYEETVDAVKAKLNAILGQIALYDTDADGFTSVTEDKIFKVYVNVLDDVQTLKDEAALLIQMKDVNGKPYFDADAVNANLEEQIELLLTMKTDLQSAIDALAEGQEAALLNAKIEYIKFVEGDATSKADPKDSKGKVVRYVWNKSDAAAIVTAVLGTYEEVVDVMYDEAQAAALDALVEKTTADIEAAKSIAEIEKIFATAHDEYTAIPTTVDHATDWANGGKLNNAFVKADYNKELVAYVNYFMETKVTGTGTYPTAIKAEKILKDIVYPVVYEAYTVEELAAKVAEAKAAVDKIATKAEIAEQKKAVETLINNLPATITAADKDAVLAAADAYDAYNKVLGATPIVNKAKLDSAVEDLGKVLVESIEDAYDALADKKVITLEDKAAIEALRSAYDEYVELRADYRFTASVNAAKDDDNIEALEEALLKAQIADAKAQIIKLPANPTEKDRAQVEAARAAFNALPIEVQYSLIRTTLYKTLIDAEEALDVYAIKTVESLKVVKNHSVAGKGYIKIAWSTKGDDSAVKGYQIYRATKANGKYTKFFTTSKKTYKNTKSLKKGTKYFYKVRAYAEIDGVKYYSDWSNKAYRVAK